MVGRTREDRRFNDETLSEKRKVILAALAKATEDVPSLAGTRVASDETIDEYYTLSREEIGALVNGDIEKIEGWVSRLDKPHAAWLLRWLIRESL